MKARLARIPVLGTALRVQQRYVEDAADSLAASIGFFAFLSLFPLLALTVAIAGLVVGDDPARLAQVADAVEGAIPALGAVTGTTGEGEPSAVSAALENAAGAAGEVLSITTPLLLLAGLRVVAGAQRASALVFRRELPTGLSARAGQLLALVVLGLLALGGATAGASIGVNTDSVVTLGRSLALSGVSFGLDLALFLVAYRLLTPDDGPGWGTLLPGALLAAVGWTALKLFGAQYIGGQTDNPTYAGVGGVVGLLVLLYLAGRLYVYGAELSAILAGIDVPDLGEEAPPEPEPAPVPDVPPTLVAAARFAATGAAVGLVGRALARAGADRDDTDD
jgi:membrane protein